MSIIIPKKDTREYKHIRLDNGLDVVIIHDPDTDISAASMAVNVGSYDNEDEFLGLAHFLEHMLFHGSKKYPEEDEFKKMIALYDGYSNAYTSDQVTNYHFSVLNKGFIEGGRHNLGILDVFANFFIHPLLIKDMVDREIEAVHSEHEKNVLNDSWRIHRLLQWLANKNHKFHKFSTGTLTTLRDGTNLSLYDALRGFFDKFYSANIMKLVVYSNNEISIMEEYIKKTFGDIKNKNVILEDPGDKIFDFNPINQRNNHIFVRIKPNRKLHSLRFHWILPETNTNNRKNILGFLSEVISYRNKGCLYDILFSKGYINGLGASVVHQDSRVCIMSIIILLTELGASKKAEIVGYLYGYLEFLKKNLVVEQVYNDVRKSMRMGFESMDNEEPDEYVSRLSTNMLQYRIADIISEFMVMDEFTPETETVIRKYLELITPNRAIIISSSDKYEIQDSGNPEPYYNIEYELHEDRNIAEVNIDDPGFLLPGKNEFIPEHIEKAVNIETDKKYPDNIGTGYDLWYMYDNQFRVSDILLDILLFKQKQSMRERLIDSLVTYILDARFERIFADAGKVMGIPNIGTNTEYVTLAIRFYSTKIAKVIELLAETISSTKQEPITKIEFYNALEAKKKIHQNTILQQPYMSARVLQKTILVEGEILPHEKLEMYKDIQIDEVDARLKGFFDNLSPVAFAHGDLTEQTAKELIGRLINTIKTIKLKPSHTVFRNDFDDNGWITLTTKSGNEKEDNSAVILSYDTGVYGDSDDDYAGIARSKLIQMMIGERFFQKLRTEKTLGYMVRATGNTIGVYGKNLVVHEFAVQSTKMDTKGLTKEITEFVKEFAGEIREMDDKTFNGFKETLKSSITQRFTTIDQAAEHNINIILNDSLKFDYHNRLAAAVNPITKEDIISFYDKHYITLPRIRSVGINKGIKN